MGFTDDRVEEFAHQADRELIGVLGPGPLAVLVFGFPGARIYLAGASLSAHVCSGW